MVGSWWKGAILTCARQSTVEAIQATEFNIKQVVISCGSAAFLGWLTSPLKGESIHFDILKAVAQKSPQILAESLKELGLTDKQIDDLSTELEVELK